jgi:transcriptional regulator with XRE-family HTH domain
MIDQDKKMRFIELRANGWSFDKIATEIGVSKPTLIKFNKKYAARICEAKRIKLEEAQEKYYLSAQKKIELYGKRLLAFKDLLDKRDLSVFTTAQLLEYEARYIKMGKEINF